MASNFAETANVKTAVRVLATPIDTLANYLAMIQDIVDDNPWECTGYQIPSGTIDPIVRSTGSFSGVVVYTDGLDVTARIAVRAPNSTKFTNYIAALLANATMTATVGGTPSHEQADDTFSIVLNCHSADGELYNVTFKRDRIIVSSYESGAIVTDLDTWADSIPALD